MRGIARLKIQMAGKTYMLQREKALVMGDNARRSMRAMPGDRWGAMRTC
jgi:hypothetical protein